MHISKLPAFFVHYPKDMCVILPRGENKFFLQLSHALSKCSRRWESAGSHFSRVVAKVCVDVPGTACEDTGCPSQQIRGAAQASVFLTSFLQRVVQVPHFENDGEVKKKFSSLLSEFFRLGQ